MGEIEDPVEDFAAALRQLRRDVGQPSFRELESHARKAGSHLPASTASDAVRGRRLPKLEVVIAFVLACRKYAEEAKIPMPGKAREMYVWQQDWATASDASGMKENQSPKAGVLSPRENLRPVYPAHPGRSLQMPNRYKSSYVFIADDYEDDFSGVDRDVEKMMRGLELAAPWMTVTTCLNPTYEEAQEAVSNALETPSELLVLHALGHGYLNETARLSLKLADTMEDDLLHTTLDLEGLLPQAAQVSSDRTVILIIDTAFAGAAIPRTPPRLDSWFVLAATGANSRHALALPTSLSEVLAELLQHGVRECPYPMVTIVDLAMKAREVLLTHSLSNSAAQTVTWGGSHGVQQLGFAFNRQK